MEPKAASDADLVARTLTGDREAFGELYDRYARLVRAVVASVSGDWPGVEDMTQECFLRAYRNLARLRDPRQFGSWLTGIARRVGRERRRAKRRDRHQFGADPPEIGLQVGGGDEISDRDQFASVMRRLADLPEAERMAIHAFYFEERNAQRAAGVVGVSRSGLYGLLKRAVARLAAPNKSPASKARNR